MVTGKYLNQESVDDYWQEQKARREERALAERKAALRRTRNWALLVLADGCMIAMILNGLIDTRIGVVALAAVSAAIARGTK